MINYNFLQDAITFYGQRGFTQIESPWVVPEWIDRITRPEDIQPNQLKHNDKCLVASGEQSFLYLMHKEFLPPGQYQTVTPCFRNDKFDYLHSKYFIKNELIKTDVVDKYELRTIVAMCKEFFDEYLTDIEWIETDDGFDLTYKGHELGSYGIREHKGLRWIYGTGVAEPRLSKLMKMGNNGLS